MSYIWVFDPIWVHFVTWCETGIQIHSFAWGCPVVSAPFVGKAILSPLNGLGTFVKISWQRCMSLFLDSQFYSICLQVYPYASTTLCWLLFFVVHFEIGKCEFCFVLCDVSCGYIFWVLKVTKLIDSRAGIRSLFFLWYLIPRRDIWAIIGYFYWWGSFTAGASLHHWTNSILTFLKTPRGTRTWPRVMNLYVERQDMPVTPSWLSPWNAGLSSVRPWSSRQHLTPPPHPTRLLHSWAEPPKRKPASSFPDS